MNEKYKNNRLPPSDEVWSWKNTENELRSMHMDPFYSISTTSGLQLRKTFNFNHAIDYLAATTSFGGETFIAVQSLAAKSIVHIWNTVQHKNCKVKLQYRINSFIIVHSLMIGVALCGDGKLRIFTSVPTLVEVAAFDLEKPATYPVYNPFRKDILLGGISEVNVWSFCEMNKNEPKTSLSEAVRMNLVRGQSFYPNLGEEWVTCITIDERSTQVVIAGETMVCIADAHSYQTKHIIKTHVTSTITQCTLYVSMDYAITGHQDGSVNIWSNSTYNNIDRIKAHQAKVTGLEVHYGMGLLITVSLDKTIKAIRLSSLEEVYNIMTGDKMANLKVLDRNSLAYCTKYCVKVWNLYQVDTLVNRLYSEVRRIRRTGEGQLLVEAEDGGLRLICAKDGEIITTVFSATTTGSVTLRLSAYNSSRNVAYVLNTEEGYVEGYNCETHPASLALLYKTQGQRVAALCEAYLGIPYWLPSAKRSKVRAETMLCLLIIGTSEGQLIVSEAPDWLHLPPPINIERGLVQNMEASPAGEGNKKCSLAVLTGAESPSYISVYLLSISTDNNLSINLRHVLNLTTPVSLFHISNVYLMVTFKNVLAIVKFPSILEKDTLHSTMMEPTTTLCEPYLEIHKHCPNDGHLRPITDIDALPSLEIFVTVGAEDNFMKLWDNKNTLLREILFSTPVHGVAFVTDFGAIFCSSTTNINVIPVANYLPPQYIQKLLNLDTSFAPLEKLLPVASSSNTSGQEPAVIPISLYNRRKEKISRMQTSEGRFSKYGRKKRDPPRDDDSSSSGRGETGSKGGRIRSGRGEPGGGGSSGGSSRSCRTNEKSQEPGRGTSCSDSSEKSNKSHKTAASLEAVEEDVVMELVPHSSEYTVIEQPAFPCAPDGYIPNSVTRLFFSHLLEFRLLFDQARIPPPPLPIHISLVESEAGKPATLSIPASTSIHSDLSHASTEVSRINIPNIQSNLSYLFQSTTSEESQTENGSVTEVSSTNLLDVINSSSKSVQEKRSTFAGIALKEVPSYESAERSSTSQKSIKFENGHSVITIPNSESTVSEPEGDQVPELLPEITKGGRKASESTRKASVSKRNSVPKQKKRRSTIKAKKAAQLTGLTEVDNESQSGPTLIESTSIQSQEEESPQQPSVNINSQPEIEAKSFKENVKDLEKVSCLRTRLVSLSQCFDTISTDKDCFLFIKTFDQLLHDADKESLEGAEIQKVCSVILDLFRSEQIDSAHSSELLRHLMQYEMEDVEKFNVLGSLIGVQTSTQDQTMKDVVLEILPFLVNEDESIKNKAFQQLSEFANVSTKEDLRTLLVNMNVLRDSAEPEDIKIVSDGKILNIQYWKNKLDTPQPNATSKTSEEIQIISEVEIAIDPHSFSNNSDLSTMTTIRNNNSNTLQTTTASDKSRQKADSTRTLNVSDESTRPPPVSLVDLDHDLEMSGPEPEVESEEDALVRVPSIDIKRKIMSSISKPIKAGNQKIGTVRDKGKLFNSANDLLLWFQRDDDQFYDTKNKVVGSLLPNGNVSVPEKLELFAESSVTNHGKEMVKNAGSCDNQGRIKNSRGETLGKLTKEGEFISKDGILYTCDGVYAGKKCLDGNRMYINGEIFDTHNNYWGHVGPDNTMIHLSGCIFDSSGIRIGNIEDYGAKLSWCVKNCEVDDINKTDSGVSVDQEEGYTNREIRDTDGSLLGKFKNKDTIITTCGDIFDRGGVYLGQLLANGHIMMKQEATRLPREGRSTVVTQCRSRGKPDSRGKPGSRKSRGERMRSVVAEAEAEAARLKRAREIGDEWSRHRQVPDEDCSDPDPGYLSEDKLLFDLTESLPLLPILNEIKGQRLVKTITFSRSVSSFQNKNFHIEPMPSVLNAHTTTSDGNTQFGMLKVDWTTRSFDPDGVQGRKLPPLQPPPPSTPGNHLPDTHPAMKDSAGSPLMLPRINKRSGRGSGDYLMKVMSSYLQKEIKEEMKLVKYPVLKVSGGEKVCTTPITRITSRRM